VTNPETLPDPVVLARLGGLQMDGEFLSTQTIYSITMKPICGGK